MQDVPLRASLPHSLVRLFRLVNRAHNRALKPLELSAEQAHVLSVLWELGPMTIGELQRLLALSSPTLTGAIDRMAGQELVRRVPSPTDRRAVRIEPLAGTAMRREMRERLDATERECFHALTAAERKELLRLVDKAIAGMDARVES